MKNLLPAFIASFIFFTTSSAQQKTFCNPINIDYGYTPIPNFSEQGRHRATADPVITLFKGNYYLFSTNQWGYWFSSDMLKWKFVPRKFLKPYIMCMMNYVHRQCLQQKIRCLCLAQHIHSIFLCG